MKIKSENSFQSLNNLVPENRNLGLSPPHEAGSPQALLPQYPMKGEDHLNEDQEYLDGNDSEQISDQSEAEELQDMEELKAAKIQKAYVEQFYRLLLRPIVGLLAKFYLIFVALLVSIKLLWGYSELTFLRYEQQNYLKEIMGVEINKFDSNIKKTFGVLDDIHQIFLVEVSAHALGDQYESSCQEFGSTYLCETDPSQNMTFYKNFDLNYEVVAVEILKGVRGMDITNVFFFSESNDGFLELNLTDISASKQQLVQEKALKPGQIIQLKNYINSLSESGDSEYFSSYLDESLTRKGRFQMYKIVKGEERTQTEELFTVSCLQVTFNFPVGLQEEGKCCVILSYPHMVNTFDNIFYAETEYPKILINSEGELVPTAESEKMDDLYNLLSNLVQNQIAPFYPEYTISREQIVNCIDFHDEFFELFSSENVEIETFKCYNTNYMHLLLSKYIFSWGILEIEKSSYQYLKTEVFQHRIFEIQCFVFSNQTYYANVNRKTEEYIQEIEWSIQASSLVMVLLAVSFAFAKNIILETMIPSMRAIKELGKQVRDLEEVRKSSQKFQSILNRLPNRQTDILTILIGYFQKFMWIKKWSSIQKGSKVSKRRLKKLLLEGLRLFKYDLDLDKQGEFSTSQYLGTSKSKNELNDQKNPVGNNYLQYPEVLWYIYQELISLQKQRIESLTNIKLISNKRKTSFFKKQQSENEIKVLNGLNNDSSEFPKIEGESHSSEHSGHQIEERSSLNEEASPHISIDYYRPRENKGVRFSNLHKISGPKSGLAEKKSKFLSQIKSNSTLGNKSSLKSVKSFETESRKKQDSVEKSEKSEQENTANQNQSSFQSRRIKKDTTIKKILIGEHSVHEGLKSIKFDESQLADQASKLVGDSLYFDGSLASLECQTSLEENIRNPIEIYEQTLQSHEQIISYYEKLIEIKRINLENQVSLKSISFEEESQRINQIYEIEVKRLKTCHEYLETILSGVINGLESKELLEGVAKYDNLNEYENSYEIHQNLVDEATIYKMKISVCLGDTISYKQLEQLCNSEDLKIKQAAINLYCQELSKLEPFLDFEVMNRCAQSLCEENTTNLYKRSQLRLMAETLQRNPEVFEAELKQLKLINRFYNKSHRKFYFVADMTESYDIFTPVLSYIYKQMNTLDLMQVYNLGMMECKEDMELVGEIVKPKKLESFLALFEQLTLELEKTKDKMSLSGKNLLNRRHIYERDFKEILDAIQKDENDFCSYLVIILGADQIYSQSTYENDADSSNNQRQFNQMLYSEINRMIEKNYYHIVMLGTNLNNFMTKQGKLKKHIKSSFDLLEIDLATLPPLEYQQHLNSYLAF